MMRNVREKKRGRVKSEEDEKIEATGKVRRDDISAVFENDPSDGLMEVHFTIAAVPVYTMQTGATSNQKTFMNCYEFFQKYVTFIVDCTHV